MFSFSKSISGFNFFPLTEIGSPFLNEIFTFINPKETSHCGCGVSITFDLNAVEQDENKITAINI